MTVLTVLIIWWCPGRKAGSKLGLGREVAVDFGNLEVEEVGQMITVVLRRVMVFSAAGREGGREFFDDGKEFFAAVGACFDSCS